MSKKILYVDMDNVLVDFKTGIDTLGKKILLEYEGRLDEVPHIFSKMEPMQDAIESYIELADFFDTYILTTSPWENHTAWSDKLNWVKKYLGEKAYKRLILTHNKHLNHGDFLIDDRTKNGADRFTGELILFGSEEFPDWVTIKNYLLIKNETMKKRKSRKRYEELPIEEVDSVDVGDYREEAEKWESEWEAKKEKQDSKSKDGDKKE